MKKSLPIIIILVVIVGGLIGWRFLGKGKTTSTSSKTQPAETSKEASQGESFTGKLKDAFMRGVSLKCTYKFDDKNFGTGWLKNKKYYGEITTNGKLGYLIIVDNCLWSWLKDQNKGAKMCFEVKDGKDIWDEMDTQNEAFKNEYHCVPAVVNDAVFTPPSNIQFIDIDKMAEGFDEQPTQPAMQGEEE